MITAETVLDYGNRRIDKYAYFNCPPDCANSGKDRITYEVYDNSVGDLIEAFDTLDEAIEYTENEIIWHWLMADCLPYEVQTEHNKALKTLQIWYISNLLWIAEHEGEEGVAHFKREVAAELFSE